MATSGEGGLEVELRERKASVRSQRLSRHAAGRTRDGRVLVFASGLGAPRTWSFALEGAVHALVSSIDASPDAQSLIRRMDAAFVHAREALVVAGRRLLDRDLPDVGMLALGFEQGHVHAFVCGAFPVYLYAGAEPRRLTPRVHGNEGLLHHEPERSSAELTSACTLLAGSPGAFSIESMGMLALLLREPRTPLGQLADEMARSSERSATGGIGAAIRLKQA